jgi:hypothetical protein
MIRKPLTRRYKMTAQTAPKITAQTAVPKKKTVLQVASNNARDILPFAAGSGAVALATIPGAPEAVAQLAAPIGGKAIAGTVANSIATTTAPIVPYLAPVAGALVYTKALKYGNAVEKVGTTVMATTAAAGGASAFGGITTGTMVSTLGTLATNMGLPATVGTAAANLGIPVSTAIGGIGTGTAVFGGLAVTGGFVTGRALGRHLGLGTRGQYLFGTAGALAGALAVPGVTGAVTGALAAAPATWGLAAAATTAVTAAAPFVLPTLALTGAAVVAYRAIRTSSSTADTVGTSALGATTTAAASAPLVTAAAATQATGIAGKIISTIGGATSAATALLPVAAGGEIARRVSRAVGKVRYGHGFPGRVGPALTTLAFG